MRLRKSLAALGSGLLIQIPSFLGVFLSTVFASHLLDAFSFGVYISTLAVATLLASLVSLGLDKVGLRLAGRAHGDPARLRQILNALLATVSIGTVLLLCLTFGAFIAGRPEVEILAAMITVTIALRMIIGGFLRGAGRRVLGLIGTFSFQPIAVSALFGTVWLFAGANNSFMASSLIAWLLATLLLEGVQVVLLLAASINLVGPTTVRDIFSSLRPRRISLYLRIGMALALWAVLAQTGLLSLSLSTWFFSPQVAGEYGVAYRISQLLWFPMMSASQMMLPMVVQARSGYREQENYTTIIYITRIVTIICAAGFILYVLFGRTVFEIIFGNFSDTSFVVGVILGFGNLVLCYFGINDQALSMLGQQKQALAIAFLSGTFLVISSLVAGIVWGSIFVFAIITVIAAVSRAYFSGLLLTKLIGKRINAL